VSNWRGWENLEKTIVFDIPGEGCPGLARPRAYEGAPKHFNGNLVSEDTDTGGDERVLKVHL
jgi:hypothetical protein